MTTNYKWIERSICSYYHEVKTGRIVGKVLRMSLGDDVFHAEVHGDSLGEYISEKQARIAVEDKIRKNDLDDEYFILTKRRKTIDL